MSFNISHVAVLVIDWALSGCRSCGGGLIHSENRQFCGDGWKVLLRPNFQFAGSWDVKRRDFLMKGRVAL